VLHVEALGVSGSPAPGRLTSAYRVQDGPLIDAGGAPFAIDPGRWSDLTSILLTHAHLDHTMGLPFLVAHSEPAIYGLAETLDTVREHLFNGRIFPDLADRARWIPVEIGQAVEIDGFGVSVGPAVHSAPCVSYLIERGGRRLALIGDTCRDDAVLEWAAGLRPTACVVECSLSDARRDLAAAWGHQTPSDLPAWRTALGEGCPLYVVHTKPAHDATIRAECEALSDPHLRLLHDGDTFDA
jgi:glyoxylase-like metal-dependent hydrolase (beta-lactamase superfamily II)